MSAVQPSSGPESEPTQQPEVAAQPGPDQQASVSEYKTILPQFVFANSPDNFTAGKTRDNFEKWCSITSDMNILSWISGVSIDFIEPVNKGEAPIPIKFAEHDA